MLTPEFFTSVIDGYLPNPQASLLNGILFGIPLKTDPLFNQELKTVGLIHLVVLSGTNITLLSAICTQLLHGFSKKISSVITILILIFFVAFVGIQAPIIRAALMGIFTLVANLYGRKTLTLYLLVLSACLSLLLHPKWLSSLSFQLSYAATLGIILFNKPVLDKSETAISRFMSYCRSNLRTSLSAQVFTTPLIWLQFHQISLISPIANVCVDWLIVPLMIFGFLTAVLGKVHFMLGAVPSFVCYFLLSYMVAVITILSHLPFAAISF